MASQVNDELSEFLEDRDFDDLKQVQSAADAFMLHRNNKPIDDFHGLSATQMQCLLDEPFATGVLNLRFSEVDNIASCKVMILARYILNGIGDGIKATAKGNLPKSLVLEALTEHDKYFERPWSLNRVNKEEDFFDLHVARLLLTLLKIIRIFKGKWIITAHGKTLIKANGSIENREFTNLLYQLMLECFCKQYNWAYRSYDEQYSFIQQSVGFSLYLLQKYGNVERLGTWYANEFINAFPDLLLEINESYFTPEQALTNCYSHWLFKNFGEYFGLLSVKGGGIGNRDTLTVKATPLFWQIFTPNMDGVVRSQL